MKSRFEFHGEVEKIINGTTIFLAPRAIRDTAATPTGSRGRRKRRQQLAFPQRWKMIALVSVTRETLINGVREWNREPSCSRFPHRGKEVPIEHVFRRFR
ncbi:hypothetical protein, partial [Ralstonia pseudosolanacearum]